MGADKRIGIGLVMLLVSVVRVGWWKKAEVRISSGQRVKITVRVNHSLEDYYGKQRITVSGIYIYVPEGVMVEYGDKLIIIGTIEEKVLGDDRKILSLNDQIFEKIENWSTWDRYLVNIRQITFYNLRRWLGGDEGELAAGIVVGGSGEMSRVGKDNFRRTGVSHIVAASGYNVSVVAGVILSTAAIVGRKFAMWFVILGVGLYVFLAGMSAAVVRAGAMGILAIIGLMMGRKSDGYWLLAISSWLMVMINPGYIEDIGFQLSVVATAGVLWASSSVVIPTKSEGRVEGSLDSLRSLGMTIKNDLKVTLAAIVMTTPIILYYFGNLSVAAPVVNLLVVPVVPLVMGIVGVASLVGLVVPVLGQTVSWLAWPVLKYMTWIVNWFGGQGWSSWEVDKVGWVWVAGYYLILVICIKYWRWRR